MLDGSMEFREPTSDEIRLLRALLARSHRLDLRPGWLSRVRVKSMCDGGMGSFRISTSNNMLTHRSLGAVAAELQFTDADGAEVLVTLNTDTEGEPFEVDVWRTDFKPVIRIPDHL